MRRFRHVLACGFVAAGALLAARARARVVTATLGLAGASLGLVTDLGVGDLSVGYVAFGNQATNVRAAALDALRDRDLSTSLSAEFQRARTDGSETSLLPVDIAAFNGTPWEQIEKGAFHPDIAKRIPRGSFEGVNRPGTMANLVGSFAEARPSAASFALLGSGVVGLGFTTSRRRRRAGRVLSGAIKRIGG